MDAAPPRPLPLWPRPASRWDSCPPCSGTVASSPGASALVADAGGRPGSLSPASAASEAFPLASALPAVCACIPTQSGRAEKGHVTTGTHITTLSSGGKTCSGGMGEL